jgi:hypothetical protein
MAHRKQVKLQSAK